MPIKKSPAKKPVVSPAKSPKSPAKSAVKAAKAAVKAPALPAAEPVKNSWVGRVPQLQPGKYEDGIPFNDLNYLAFKLLLKPNRFVSRKSLFDFGKVLKGPCVKNGVTFSSKDYINEPIKVREVIFIDTPDFRLYNNAFILRRRVEYIDGFPLSDPEIVFKYRSADFQKTAEIDVRPHKITGDHTIKFKCQVLPLKDELGGIRILYSQNVQFPRSNVKLDDVTSFDEISEILPALKILRKTPGEKVQLVNETIVEEVLQDIGEIDFGGGMAAKANVGIWRIRGSHKPMIAEFAFQFKCRDRAALGREQLIIAEKFFIDLQYAAKDWLALNATKTGVVYKLLGYTPKSHE